MTSTRVVFKNEIYNMWSTYLQLRELCNLDTGFQGHLNSTLIDVFIEHPEISSVSIAAFGKHLQFMLESHDKDGVLQMPTPEAFKTWYESESIKNSQ